MTLTDRLKGLKINGLLDLKDKKVLAHLSRTERENNHTERERGSRTRELKLDYQQ